MKTKKFCALTEAFGFGCMATVMGVATGKNLLTISLKNSQKEFEKEVDQIYGNLKGIAEWYGYSIEKATWDEKDRLLEESWLPVEEFKAGTMPEGIWAEWADAINSNFLRKKSVEWQTTHPLLAEMAQDKKILAVNIQKWLSHSTEVEAEKQSLESSASWPIASLENTIKVFTSHFSKVNDLEKVEEMKGCLGGMYVPGETEAEHLFGVRGIKHAEYIPLVFATDATVTIASTWQWLVQIINPAVNMNVLCNKALPDARYAKEIQDAMAAYGYSHRYTLFTEGDDVSEVIEDFLKDNKMD